ncbi:MAG: penicillin-binding protein 1C [Cyclobacteriaceae bacterium]
MRKLFRSGKKYVLFPLAGCLVAFVVYLCLPLGQQQLRSDYSQVILASDGSFLRVYLNDEEQYLLPPQLQDSIPANLKKAVLTFEDQHFYLHPGINPVALIRAAYWNIRHREVVSGGSTITMQLARMIRHSPRTYWNKFQELLLAIKLEVHLSKEEILAEYLMHAPYGSNVRGYLAASHRFFGKRPDQLTWAEAALLAVLPNAPGYIFPSSHQDKLTTKRNYLLHKMKEKGIISDESCELSLLEPIPEILMPFDLHAPHLADRIHTNNSLDVIRTTIDPEIQRETNFFVKQQAARLKLFGIHNASAMVINNVTGGIVAYVGSQDYHDLDHHGRVDGVMAPRSSGSILKPFLYALAIDEGLILPKTLIKDVPTYYNSFSPSNASETFSGVVPANEALIHSLNVPAVRLLNAYGVPSFYNQLKEAGVSTLFRAPDEYGLPIILGGAEVTPWDMGRLYRGLANGGEFQDIHYLKGQQEGYKTRLVSQGASHLILEELKELIRPGLEFYWKKYSSQRPIAWKTGTSYGHKDAWAVGTTPQWTVVVWVGNFDGESNKALAGMTSAGPLLFNIFQVLPGADEWFTPVDMDYVTVRTCKHTGFYASQDCPEVVNTKAPYNMKPLRVCPFHERYYVEHNHRVCSRCWKGTQQLTHQLAFSADINYYLRQNGNLITTVPPHQPGCPVGREGDALQIIYPLTDANIFIPKDFDGQHQQLIAKVASQFPDRKLFWYLNDELVGTTQKTGSFPLRLKRGKQYLTVVDSEGNEDRVVFSAVAN